MKILHFCAGLQFWNGMANTARQFMGEEIAQGHESSVTDCLDGIVSGIDVVYIHGAWLPVLWKVAKRAKSVGAKLIIRPAGSYDPVRLAYHGWKKRLVAFFEHRMLGRADVLLATCEAEAGWIRDYAGRKCHKVEITDLKRFFKLNRVEGDGFGFRVSGSKLEEELGVGRQELGVRGEENFEPCRSVESVEGVSAGGSFDLNHGIHGIRGKGDELGVRDQELGDRCLTHKKLNVLYLGRRHPLKGVEYLEKAVKELGVRDVENNSKLETRNLELKIVSNAFGEELEKVWAWCDVLVLPTLSENFGRVVAEALERGKRVITTDGAPVWGDGNDYDGRLVYLRGFRDGTDEVRIRLLKDALAQFVG